MEIRVIQLLLAPLPSLSPLSRQTIHVHICIHTYTGYAIALVNDILSGILSGSAFGTQVHGPYMAHEKSGVGHFVMAIDISKCRPLPEFEKDMITLISSLKASPLAQGFKEILYPGQSISLLLYVCIYGG